MDSIIPLLMRINNLFNDIAALSLPAGALVMWAALKRYNSGLRQGMNDDENRTPLFSLHARMSKITVFSLICIAVSSVPRMLTYTSYELANAAGKAGAAELIAKNVVTFAAVISGACLWVYLTRRLKGLRDGK